MENTLENKELFFSLYINQLVLKNDTDRFGLRKLDTNRNMFLNKEDYILLKDTKNINDIDAMFVGFSEYGLDIDSLRRGQLISSILESDFKYEDKIITTNYHSIDYLRLNGYATPYMGLSIDNLKEYGWIKIIK